MTYHVEHCGAGMVGAYDDADRLVCYCTDEARAERIAARANRNAEPVLERRAFPSLSSALRPQAPGKGGRLRTKEMLP